MADVKSVAVRVTADNTQYKAAMREGGDATQNFSRAQGVALAAAGIAVAAFVKSSVDAYVNLGKSTMQLSRLTGESAETSSRWIYAAAQSGVSADALAKGMKFLEKAMVAGNEEFGKLGVQVRNTGGGLRGAHDVFLDTADAISHLGTQAAKTDAITKLFGNRSGVELGKLLLKGRDGILALEAEAQKYGLVLSQDNVAAIQENIMAHRHLDAALQGLQVRIGQDVLPMLTSVTEFFSTLPGPVAQSIVPIVGITAALVGVSIIGPKVVAAFQMIAEGATLMDVAIGGLAAGGIALVLVGLSKVQEASKEAQSAMLEGNDTSTYAAQASSLNKMSTQIQEMGDRWNGYNYAEKAAHLGELKMYNDLSAQRDEVAAQFDEQTKRIKNLGTALGITAPQAQALTDSLGNIDLTHIAPETYTPILAGLASGSISSADALSQLAEAARHQATSAEDAAAATKAQEDAVKTLNDAETSALNPQFAMIKALEDQAKASKEAEVAAHGYGLGSQEALDATQAQADAQRSYEGALDRVTSAEQARQDSLRRVRDAQQAVTDAQNDLNAALNGPSEDSQISLERAELRLKQAQKTLGAGKFKDPLDQQSAELDVRQAKADLERLRKDQAGEVGKKRAALASAQDALASAQRDAAGSSKAIRDAQVDAAKAADALTKAQQHTNTVIYGYGENSKEAADKNIALAQATMAVDVAVRNLAVAFDTGKASAQQTRDILDSWVASGRVTQSEADNIATKLGITKTKSDELGASLDTPHVLTADTTPANASIDALKAKLADLWKGADGTDGRVIDIIQNMVKVGTQQVDPAKKAAGGDLTEGYTMINEIGPELLHKQGNRVSVTSAAQTPGKLVALGAAGAGTSAGQHGDRSRGYTHNGDIVINGPATGQAIRDMVYEQRKHAALGRLG